MYAHACAVWMSQILSYPANVTVLQECHQVCIYSVPILISLQVQAMYFADPPQTPDLQFCRESLDMLMKYNDRYIHDIVYSAVEQNV